MIWLNIDVKIRLSVDQYIPNLGLWTTSIRITTANRVSISSLSVTFHWCTKECGLKLFWYCSMNCCAYRLVCITMWSIICSVMYSLKKSFSVGILFLISKLYISWSKMGFLDIFYSTATEELLADCALVQLVSESLGVAQALICFANDLLELALHLQGSCLSCLWLSETCLSSSALCLSCPQHAGTCLTSSAPWSSCPWLAEASPWPISSSDILLLVLLSFITGDGLFTLTNEPFLAVIRAKYATLVRKTYLPDAGQHLDHTAK